MGRIARLVIPGIGHHVTQRGVRSLYILKEEEDKKLYISLLSKLCFQEGVEIHAYCLMDNHVHLLAVPKRAESLAKVIGDILPPRNIIALKPNSSNISKSFLFLWGVVNPDLYNSTI